MSYSSRAIEKIWLGINSFSNKIAMAISPKKLVGFGSVMLAVVLMFFGVSNFVINQLAPATTSGGGNLQSASAPSMAVQDQDMGVQYGEATGLSSSDVRLSNPLSKAINAIGDAVDSIVQPEPSYAPPYYRYGTTPSTDDREYLKTYFNATIKTRDVEEIGLRIQTTIRGYGGRIDNLSLDEKYGSISFVVPADKFEAFKQELKGFVGEKFYNQNIRMENFLPQKRAIETNVDNNTENLATLEKDKKALTSRHQTAVSSFNNQITRINNQMADLKEQMDLETNPDLLNQIRNSYNSLYNQRYDLYQRLNNENATYKRQLSSYDSKIKYVNANLKELDKQDQNLTENVETVNGSISLRWISILGIVQLYLPGFWLPLIVVALLVIAYLAFRRRKVIETV